MTEVDAPQKWKYETFRDQFSNLILYINLEQAMINLPEKREHEYINC